MEIQRTNITLILTSKEIALLICSSKSLKILKLGTELSVESKPLGGVFLSKWIISCGLTCICHEPCGQLAALCSMVALGKSYFGIIVSVPHGGLFSSRSTQVDSPHVRTRILRKEKRGHLLEFCAWD